MNLILMLIVIVILILAYAGMNRLTGARFTSSRAGMSMRMIRKTLKEGLPATFFAFKIA